MKNKIFAILFACLTFWAFSVSAAEVIESFDSLIQVQVDGSMIVTETLRVHHEGVNIRRGIYRDLPTTNGERYELLGVRRDGRHEPSFVERRTDYYRINTGDDSFLPRPGTSTFEITYKVLNVPKSYNGYDEVYWNVTGPEWAFPIESVSARVELPAGANIIQQASYIGYQGSQEAATYEGNGQYIGRYLSPGEQLTIAVGFTPGIISTEKKDSLTQILRKHISTLYLCYIIILMLLWNLVGRDPPGRAIMPQYTPPSGITAAQAAILYDKGVKKNLLAISLIQMISSGFLKFRVRSEELIFCFSTRIYTLEKTLQQARNEEEESIQVSKIVLDGRYHRSLEVLGKKIKKITQRAAQAYYKTNRIWVAIPTFLMMYIILHCFGGEELGVFDTFETHIMGLIVLGFMTMLMTQLGRTWIRQILGSIYMVVLLGLMFYWPHDTSNLPPEFRDVGFHIVLVGLVSSVFTFLMYQPSEKGQRLLEHLEGLKMFLKATKSPVKHTELNEKTMEQLFAYAMALGLEKEWEAKFKALFGVAEYHAFVGSHPYTGYNMVRAFSTATSGSSAGSSGGGSGGGGGAGGGCGGGGGGGR